VLDFRAGDTMNALPAVVVLAAVLAGQTGLKAPAGFRFPTSTDYSGDWAAFRAQIAVPFHLTADFNGDGRADQAWLLLADPAPGWALVVFLATPAGSHRVIQLQADSKEDVHRYGIVRADPGRYETACGKGFWTCEADEPAVLSLKLPALQFFVYESASAIFWWDRATGRFRRTWISD